MISRKFLIVSTFGAALAFATATIAQTTAATPPAASASAQSALRVGAAVTDPQGGAVGTISSIDGEFVVVRTDRHEARIPVASLTATEDAVLIGVTREQLNGQIEQIAAQANEAIVVGAVVRDREGALVGPVEAVDAESVTVKFGEQQIRLARSGVAPAPNGLVIGATVAELRAQVGTSPTS